MKGSPSLASVTRQAEWTPVTPVGEFVDRGGETFYRIRAFDQLAPFLMSVPSDTDLWMFVASGGGLTAGRGDADGSLFPYRPVDQIHEARQHTGPVTLFRVERPSGGTLLWEPFAEVESENPAVERNLYKNVTGNRLVFEEVHHDLRLTFRYRWSACDELGWIRSAVLENRSGEPLGFTVLDGLRNVLPYGAPLALHQQASNLVDAYKTSEIEPQSGLGIFSLSSGITDRAEAVEVLRANVVWCCGLENRRIHLSLDAVEEFRQGRAPAEEAVLKGARGNYLVSSELRLASDTAAHWHLGADSGLSHTQIVALRQRLTGATDLADEIEASLDEARDDLRRNVASADGVQLCQRTEAWAHHFANVLFNNMRGGVFFRNYDVPMDDLREFLRVRHRDVADRHTEALSGLPETITVQELLDLARASQDADFERLSYEYLPLWFGRRHGDPSRPWNRFSIRARSAGGRQELGYEGNWRDIFQNWEALATAFPGFLPSMVAKFVNASTVDGFNPYRITRDGVDWEVVVPDDPWSNIGYWGDHQIVYLLKLLEAMERYEPAAMDRMLESEIFSYAEVPYRIKPYEEILEDPATTIDFDAERESSIGERVQTRGTDGKLLTGPDGSVYHANLLEKLLVPTLSKLSNFVADGGIWMNTQRPEWNDANNALAGGGVSVVTLCYLRRHLVFLAERLGRAGSRALPVSREVVDWFERVESALSNEKAGSAKKLGDAHVRRRLMDRLGEAFSLYRQGVYGRGFSGKTELDVSRVVDLCKLALEFVDRGIDANRRSDGLYHTYHTLDVSDEESGAVLSPLPPMLEGQVAVLSSGRLSADEALEVLERLFESPLYRGQERSFMLYPERELAGFLQKNTVPASELESIPLAQALLERDDATILARDADGVIRFGGDLGNADDLDEMLTELAERPEWTEAVGRDREALLELFESVFHHRSYTGRSGVMYGFEGLGCIYWHMVAKLLLAVQEQIVGEEGATLSEKLRDDLSRMYFRVREGLGYEKTVTEFGAFPTDPYSHTPPSGGAKQPGMTGQVKEEILTRAGELGIRVEAGCLCFRPVLLRESEFLDAAADYEYVDVGGRGKALPLKAGSLAFSICQVPVVYERGTDEPWIRVSLADGETVEAAGERLDATLSEDLFSRRGTIEQLRVGIPDRSLCRV